MLLGIRIVDPFLHGCLSTIHLDILHRICTEIIKHEFSVIAEKVLAVEQQCLNHFTVDLDLTVTVEFDTGELAYQFIKHRPLGKLKGIGIINQRVTAMIKFDFRSHDLNLAKFVRRTFQNSQRHLARHLAFADSLHLIDYGL